MGCAARGVRSLNLCCRELRAAAGAAVFDAALRLLAAVELPAGLAAGLRGLVFAARGGGESL